MLARETVSGRWLSCLGPDAKNGKCRICCCECKVHTRMPLVKTMRFNLYTSLFPDRAAIPLRRRWQRCNAVEMPQELCWRRGDSVWRPTSRPIVFRTECCEVRRISTAFHTTHAWAWSVTGRLAACQPHIHQPVRCSCRLRVADTSARATKRTCGHRRRFD
jgi:hypothetical protein